MEDFKKCRGTSRHYHISLYPLKPITKDQNKKSDYQGEIVILNFVQMINKSNQ